MGLRLNYIFMKGIERGIIENIVLPSRDWGLGAQGQHDDKDYNLKKGWEVKHEKDYEVH